MPSRESKSFGEMSAGWPPDARRTSTLRAPTPQEGNSRTVIS